MYRSSISGDKNNEILYHVGAITDEESEDDVFLPKKNENHIAIETLPTGYSFQ